MKTILSTIVTTGRLAAARWFINNRSFHSSWRPILLAALALQGSNGGSQAADGCTYSIIPTNRIHGHGMATNTITIFASSSVCPWTVLNTNPWIRVTSPTNGVGSTAVTYTVAENPLTVERTGVVIVAQQRCVMVQRPLICDYSISPSNRVHGHGAATNTVKVTTDAGCAWTVINTNAWLTITSPVQGTGPATLTYVVAENPALLVDRTGVVTIGGESFSVTQQDAPCMYSVSPNDRTNGYGATTGSVSVVTSSQCSWSVVNTSSWINIMSPLNVTGGGVVQYALGDNPSSNPRSGVVQIAGHAFTLTQEGTPCAVSISPHTRTHGSGATTNTVSVVAALECPWTVGNTNNWITILSSNPGSGMITYGVAENPAPSPRTGVLVIGGESLSLTQNAASCGIDLSPTIRTHGYGRATGTVSVATLNGCGWSVVNTNPWLTILSGSSGSGDGNVRYWVEANPNPVERSGLVLIGDNPVTITQRAVVCSYRISPTNRVHGFGQNTNTLAVSTSSGCQWTVLNTNSWITMFSSTSGIGDASLTYTVSSNLSMNARSGVIRIADTFLTITQRGQGDISFQPVSRLGGGQLLFRLLGPTNAIYELERSSDLIGWTRIGDLTNTTGTAEFIDTISANPDRRFYRALRR